MPIRKNPVTIELTPDRAVLLADAINVAIDHYTRRAELRRDQSESLSTIAHRREAHTEAKDLAELTRNLVALSGEISRNLAQ